MRKNKKAGPLDDFDDLDFTQEEEPFDPQYELGGAEKDEEYIDDFAAGAFVPDLVGEELAQNVPLFQEPVGYGSDAQALSQLSDNTFADFEDRLQPSSEENIRAVLDAADPETVESYRGWYRDAHDNAQALADRHGVPLETVVGVIAAISPNMPWLGNLRAADQILSDPERYEEMYRTRDRIMKPLRERLAKAKAAVKDAEPGTEEHTAAQREAKYVEKALREQAYKYMKIPGGAFYSENFYKAKDIIDGVAPAIGPKVGVFFRSIMDPESMADTPTIDGHMANLYRGEKASLSKLRTLNEPERKEIVEAFRRVAPEYDMSPQEAHAVAWVVWRSAMEHEAKNKRKKKAGQQKKITINTERFGAVDMILELQDGDWEGWFYSFGDPLEPMYYTELDEVLHDAAVEGAVDDPQDLGLEAKFKIHVFGEERPVAFDPMSVKDMVEDLLYDKPVQVNDNAWVEIAQALGKVVGDNATQVVGNIGFQIDPEWLEQWFDKEEGVDEPSRTADKKETDDDDDDDDDPCWDGYERVPGTKRYDPGSCRKASRVRYIDEMQRQGEVATAQARPGDKVKFTSDFEKPGWPRVDAGTMGRIKEVQAGRDSFAVDVTGEMQKGAGSEFRRYTIQVPTRTVALMLHSEDDRVT